MRACRVRFAIIAADRYLGVFETFARAGWKPLRLFTLPVENHVDSCKHVTFYAQRHGASIPLERLRAGHLAELAEQGCDALVVASYPWRIPDWTPYLKYAINFHCSPLPAGRGPYPLHQALLEGRNTWGASCHQITPEFDRGDILATQAFPLGANECHESLNLKVQIASRNIAGHVAANLPGLWRRAEPQGEGS